VSLDRLRRRRQPAAVALVARRHLLDFKDRPGQIVPSKLYVRDRLVEGLAAHGIKTDELQPDDGLYGPLGGLR